MKSNLISRLLLVAVFFSFHIGMNAQLTMTNPPAVTPTDLANSIVGTGVVVSNVAITCDINSYGLFSGASNLGVSGGVVLSSGLINDIPGPPTNFISTNTSGGSSPYLTPVSGGFAVNDACVLEFDINSGCNNYVSFSYIFGSEEIYQYCNSSFNDAFAIWIEGPGINGLDNIALLPCSITPVNINNLCNANPSYFAGNTGNTVSFNEFTDILTAGAFVQTFQNYTIRVAIGDAGDSIFDSGVFIAENSLSLDYVSFQPTCPANIVPNDVIEACSPGDISLNLASPSNQDIVVYLDVQGTATNGVDYVVILNNDPTTIGGLPDSLILESGITTFEIDILPTSDGIIEGQETILVYVVNPCDGSILDSTIVYLDDQATAIITPPGPITLCPGGSAQLDGSNSFGNTYEWLPAAGLDDNTIAMPVATPTGDVTYCLTVTQVAPNGTLCISEEECIDIIIDAPQFADAGIPPAICDGGTGQLDATASGGVTYSWDPPTGLSDPTIANPTVTVSTPTMYIVTVTDANGCIDTDTVNVTISNPTFADAGLPLAICDGATGQLDASASGGVTYSWSPAAGLSDPNIANPTVTLSAAQTYTVTVIDANGCTDTDFVDVTIATATFADAGPAFVIDCNNANVTLSGSSTAAGTYTYAWTTADGMIVSGGTTLNPVVSSAGTYTLTIIDQVSLCEDVSSVTVTEDTTQPTADAGTANPLDCTNTTTLLNGAGSTAGPNITVNWTTTDGSIVSGQTTYSPTVGSAGTYTIEVTDNTNGCSSTASITVTGDSSQPVAEAGTTMELTCINTTLNLSGAGSEVGPNITYQWTALYGGTIDNGGTTLNPQISTPGTYEITVTNTSNNCTTTDLVVVTQDITAPTSNGGLDLILDCNSNGQVILDGTSSSAGMTYQWTSAIPGAISSGANTLQPTVVSAGTYTITVTDPVNGCFTSDDVTVTEDIAAPTADAGSDFVIDCNNNTATLSGINSTQGSNFTVDWTTTDGTIDLGATSYTPQVSAAGTYTVTITNTDNGCSSTDVVDVTEDIAAPSVDAGSDQQIDCGSTSVTLDGSASDTGSNIDYVWSGGNILSGGTSDSPVVDQAGTYTLTLTNTDNGCSTSATVEVTSDSSLPFVTAGGNHTITCDDTSFTLDASASDSGANLNFVWTTAMGGVIDSGSSTLTPTASTPGEYTLTITNTDNNCESSSTIVIDEDTDTPALSFLPVNQITCMAITSNLEVSTVSNCDPADLTYTWYTADGMINSAAGPTAIAAAAGTYDVTCTCASNGCEVTESVTVTDDMTLPTVDAGATQTLTCTAVDLNLDGSSSDFGPDYSYLWTTADGNIVSGSTSDSPLIDAPGTYTLTVTNTITGCEDFDTIVVGEDISSPSADAGSTSTLSCTATSVVLDGSNSDSGANITYSWSTTGGSITSGGNTANPTVGGAGTYTITVTNTDNGCSTDASVVVNQDASLPVADAGITAELTCSTLSLVLDGSNSDSGPDITYLWTTADGTIVSGDNSLAPVISSAGTYELEVTNTLNGCVSYSQVVITADENLPTADAGADQTLSCTATSLALDGSNSDAGPDITYLWTGPSIVSGGTTDAPTIDQSGTYTLTVTNTANGCESTSTVEVNLDADVPVADPQFIADIDCDNPQVQIGAGGTTTTGNITYTWVTYDGNIVSGGTAPDPTVDQAGTYTLTVTNTDNGCESTSSITIAENGSLPTADAGPDGQIDCSGLNATLDGSASETGVDITYVWTTSDGTIVSGDASTSPEVSSPGTYTLTVTNTATGCSSTSTVVVNSLSNFPVADAGTDIATCNGELQNLSASGGVSYSWSPTTGLSDSNIANPTVTVSSTTTYTLTVTNAEGCTDTDEIIVSVSNPTLDLGADIQSCDQLSTQIGVASEPGYTYSWTPSTGLVDAQSSETFVNLQTDPSNAQIQELYTLEITDPAGCTVQDEILVVVNSTPSLSIEGNTQLSVGDALTLDVISDQTNIEYEWTAGGSPNVFSTDQLLISYPTSTGNYTVTVINDAGCSTSETVNVYVELTSFIEVPSAFSPNGDGQNDILSLNYNDIEELSAFFIVDRWGEIVFSTTDLDDGWDGIFNSLDAPIGAYAYVVEAVANDTDIPIRKKGNFILIR